MILSNNEPNIAMQWANDAIRVIEQTDQIGPVETHGILVGGKIGKNISCSKQLCKVQL